MVAFPLGKLFYLGIKQLAKPISIQLRSSAAKHPFVSKYICAPPAQGKQHGSPQTADSANDAVRPLSSSPQSGHVCETETDGYEGEGGVQATE